MTKSYISREITSLMCHSIKDTIINRCNYMFMIDVPKVTFIVSFLFFSISTIKQSAICIKSNNDCKKEWMIGYQSSEKSSKKNDARARVHVQM